MEDTPPDFCYISVDTLEKDFLVWHEADWKFPLEMHRHQMGQLIYVEKGFQYLQTDTTQYLLPQHHCAWIPSNLEHKSASPLKDVFLRTLYFRTDISLDTFYNNVNIFMAPDVLREMILYTERFSKIWDISSSGKAFMNAIITSLPEMCKAALPLSIPVPKSEKLKKVVDHLNLNLLEVIDLQQVATDFAFSARTLQRLFKEEIGLTPASYLKMIRMIKAMELLSDKTESISSVAYKVGYTSVPTFSNTFKEMFGKAPYDYFKDIQEA